MKTALYIGLVIIVAGGFYLLGAYSTTTSKEMSSQLVPSQGKVDFEYAAKNLPRGGLNIPAQWFVMDTVVGEEKMMLIFGYADNLAICEHTLELAKNESPNRNFKCENAN